MLEPSFPVLKIHKDFILGGIAKKSAMCLVSELKNRGRKADDFIILDSNGTKYTVSELEFKSPSQLPLFRRLSFLHNVFSKEKITWMEFILGNPKDISLDEGKQLICEKIIELNPKWKRNGPSSQKLKERLSKATSFSELINMVSVYP